MRILHITGQKPNSTGSGVYMSGLIDNLRELGHEQCVIAGIDSKDSRDCFSQDIQFYPLVYNNNEIDYNVLGMSDIMPYKSTRYKDLSDDMIEKLEIEFKRILTIAVLEFKPDIIISNHLYLITSFVRDLIKDIKVIGICHGTCLRQLNNIDLREDYIISNIKKLDGIFVLHEQQREDVLELFKIEEKKIQIIGSGYNKDVFYNKKHNRSNKKLVITFAGKICKSKGLESLLQCVNDLNYPSDLIQIKLAGGSSNKKIYEEIFNLSKKCKYEVEFLGRLNHNQLSNLFNESHIFILPSFYEGLPIVVLEALACGCEVIVSDIKGMKKWMGNDINNSGHISYVKLPKMKSAGTPIESELYKFEKELYKSIDCSVNKILTREENNILDLEDKTWLALAKRVSKILNNII